MGSFLRLLKKFAIPAFLAAAVLTALLSFGNLRSVGSAFTQMRFAWIPFILLLAFCNYLVRFVRWHWYLRLTGVSLTVRQSWVVFFSGLALSVTPGKFGEAVKSFFVKKLTGVPVRTTLPVVFAERLTDLLSVLLLAAIGVSGFQYGSTIVWIGIAVVVTIFIVVMNPRVAQYCLDMLGRVAFLHNTSDNIRKVHAGAARLLAFRPLAIALILGIVAWLCECVAFFLTLQAFGLSLLDLRAAIFLYAFSTLVGAVTLLPGGIGTTEGSMAGLLALHGVPKELASAATIVIRLATLWFAVGLGLLFFLPNRKLLTQTSHES